jgi:hypothetical protein
VELLKSKPESASLPARLGTLPPSLGDQILPPRLRKDLKFLENLVAVNTATGNLLLKHAIAHFGLPPQIKGLSDSEYESIEKVGASAFYSLLDTFRLKELPVDCSADIVSQEGGDQSDIAVTLLSLQLVDAERCSWEQLLSRVNLLIRAATFEQGIIQNPGCRRIYGPARFRSLCTAQ